MKKISKILAVAVTLFPMITLAAIGDESGLANIVTKFLNAIKLIIPILFAAITIFFLWGIVQFIMAGGDEEKKKKSKDLIIYSVIGMFVAVAIWGIVGAIGGIFDIDTNTTSGNTPVLPGQQ